VNLTNLEVLALPRNLHGPFPEGIWQLPNLKFLEIRDGGVVGTIPNNILAPMENLYAALLSALAPPKLISFQ
jgi:hypothetical protein